MMHRSATAAATIAVLVSALAVSANAAPAPAPASSGSGAGKVSMQDLHFSSRSAAVAACDKAPVTAAADGSFTCSVPADSPAAKAAKPGYDLKKGTKS
jgi:hypothetical protein